MNEDTLLKNMKALDQAAKQDREKVAMLEAELRATQSALASLTEELRSLRLQVVTLLARGGGAGPTKR